MRAQIEHFNPALRFTNRLSRAIKQFGNRVNMIDTYFTRRKHWTAYPQEIVIEITNHCNLACTMCPHKSMQRAKGFMEPSLFQNIIDQVANRTELVYLYGTGESLLHKDLLSFARYAKAKGLYTCLSTNGLLMDPAMGKGLLTSGIDFLIIALDGGTKSTYERIRKKGHFDRLLENIRTLLAMKATHISDTKVILQLILMLENMNEIEKFYSLFTPKELKSIHQIRLKPLYATYALSQKKIKHTRPCFFLWNMMSIYWNGQVPLCCMDADAAYNLGNALQEPIVDIWHANPFYRIRNSHRRMCYDDMLLCTSCDIPEQGYFSPLTILPSAFINAGQMRALIPYYEKYIIRPQQGKKNTPQP